MKKKQLSYWAVATVFMASICSPANAAILISGVGTHANPTGSSEGLSGICYAGGTQYYAVDDSGGLMQSATITVDPSSGAITAASFSPAITLGGSDLEGIDYNAVNNSIFVSDESGATVKEYTLAGSNLSAAPVPSIFSSYRSNYSLESLTIRGDGLEMWTCNEEALYDTSPVVNDGPLSTDNNGSVVRLQRFTRDSVHDEWVSAGQWAYLTEDYGDDSSFTSAERSGVSDLCVLPDGTLLVLERALGFSWLVPYFKNRIYEVDFTGATDISAITSLDGATYTRVAKTQRWSGDFGQDYNFEGLCLGPRLDGDALSLLMIADGDGDQYNGLYALKLTGLSTRQLTVNAPAYGIADPVGGSYRYETGTTVTNTISGGPFLQGGYRYECTGWTATGHTPSSGSGTTAILTLANDVQLTWNWEQVSNPSNTLNYAETFESYSEGFQMSGRNGWVSESLTNAVVSTNSAWIESLAAYGEACGYPVVTNHAKVLEVNGSATNRFEIDAHQIVWLDCMARATQTSLGLVDTAMLDGLHVAVAFNTSGHPVVWHYDIHGGSNRWSEISEVTLAEGEWVRQTLMLDYQTDDFVNQVRYFQIRLNGILLTNSMAWTVNDGAGTGGGSWFAMSSNPDRMRYFLCRSEGGVMALDDLVVTTDNPLSRDVVIVSEQGQADPAVGTRSYTYGDNVTLSLTNSTLIQGTNQFVYTGWDMSGHAPASGTDTNVTITLTNDLTLDWLWVTNNTLAPKGTPEWWLTSHGLTNGTFAEEELVDGDLDGMRAWEEWVSDTNPTNGASVLQLTSIQIDGDGVRLEWQGGVLVTQRLEWTSDLLSTNAWTSLFTNKPPTSIATNFTDFITSDPAGFYRIKADR